MKLVKFFAVAVAAVAMLAACEPEENKQINKPVELTESKILCDVSAGDWENCNAYAWTDAGEPLGSWPGTELTEKEGDYYVWIAPANLCGQTIGFILNNGTEQTVDINIVVSDGLVVALTEKGADGKWLASGGDVVEPEPVEPEEEPVVVLAEHTWGVIGSFNGWNADVEMTIDGNSATATIEILADDDEKKFKVRADADWNKINYGFTATEELTAAPVDGTEFPATWKGGDIVVAEAGIYEIVLTIEGETETFKITKK